MLATSITSTTRITVSLTDRTPVQPPSESIDALNQSSISTEIAADYEEDLIEQFNKSLKLSAPATKEQSEKLIFIFSQIRDISSLTTRLDALSKTSGNSKSIENYAEEEKGYWIFTANMIDNFLNHNFISASTIFEITQLKPFMQEELWQKVQDKFQIILDFSIKKIDKYKDPNKDNIKTNKEINYKILILLNNLWLLIKYTKSFSLQKNNLEKILNTLTDTLQNISLHQKEYQKKINILTSLILIEIATQAIDKNFNLTNFDHSLDTLFNYFNILKKEDDSYLAYRAAYICQILISIYPKNQEKSDNQLKLSPPKAATESDLQELSNQIEDLNISDAKKIPSSQIISLGKDKKLPSLGLSNQQLSSWYIKLCRIKQKIAKYGIENLEFSSITKHADKLPEAERKLFLLGIYEYTINLAFISDPEESTQKEALEILKNILEYDQSLINYLDFFKNNTLISEEIFYWRADIVKTDQRIKLDNWINNLSSEKKLWRTLSKNFKKLLSDPIFKNTFNSNYLFKYTKRKSIKNEKKNIYKKIDQHQFPIASSEFRFLRRLKNAKKDGKNIASIKLVKKSGKTRQVVYVIAYSMDPTRKRIIWNKPPADPKSKREKRGHSEPVLLATQEIGSLLIEGKEILDLTGFKKEYSASTNQACSKGQGKENCRDDLLSLLKPMLYANPYENSDDSAGFQELLEDHNTRRDDDFDPYASEDESEDEDECKIVVVNEDYLIGKDLAHAQNLGPVPARRLSTFLTEIESGNSSDSVDNSSLKSFSPPPIIITDYPKFTVQNHEISLIQENKQSVTLGIKTKFKVKKNEIETRSKLA